MRGIMATLDEIKQRLAELGLEKEYRFRRELRLLPDIFESGEHMRAVTSGVYEGLRRLVVLTEERLLVLQKPTLGKPNLLYVPRGEITDVEARNGLLFAVLTVHTTAGPFVFHNTAKKSVGFFLGALGDLGAQGESH